MNNIELPEQEKVLTQLEAIDKMIEEGAIAIIRTKNSVTKGELMDRMGKRLVLRGDKYARRVGEIQQALAAQKTQLKNLEEAQEMLIELRADLLTEGASVSS